ncbi:LOW QUALITY PROTEIN: hypothetical protein TorRG33x02_105940 [Trema orientale]|uniref:Uncharacterized protein n=1 Tax=Trema orientale TaxID=63057 RepID=A0A2P5F740_TREOI|nr:LOW QUALITY PROTEIN: hypothetical protein TorRG33x02_105940 [Trema orientale]
MYSRMTDDSEMGFPLKDRNLLVDWIVLEKQWTFVDQVFYYIFIGDALNLEGQFHPLSIWASPHTMQLHFVLLCHTCSLYLSQLGSDKIHALQLYIFIEPKALLQT